MAFLQEMCGLAAKNLQAETRIDLFSKLVSLGLFEVRRIVVTTYESRTYGMLCLLCRG